ncbi:EGF-like calcium-binding domain [Trinorchestia longiramus]|nr:EGF-like calcium-binding domain [Trinorchestia longiramus]
MICCVYVVCVVSSAPAGPAEKTDSGAKDKVTEARQVTSKLRKMLVLVLGFSVLVWSGSGTHGVEQPPESLNSCKGDQFECKTGGVTHRCIPSLFVCDNNVDCLDKSDEDPEMCANYHELTVCTEEQFECPTNKRCLPLIFKCDGDKDCEDNADELDCPIKKCLDDKFECASGDKCLVRVFVCDGNNDCEDASDEQHCECSALHSFHCIDGNGCPPVEKVCDHKVDCSDGSDEGGRCSEDSCPLQCGPDGQCYKTPNGPRCNCRAGFKEDRHVCQDVDECADMLTCDHSCRNIPGNYSCSCKSGYELDAPETCRATGSSSAILFHTFHTEVRAITIDTEEEMLIHSGTVMAIAVAYDPIEQKVYWSDHSNKIYRKSLRSEDLELVVSKDLGVVYSLAIDWAARNLYVSDNSSDRIVVCNIVHKACTDLNVNTRQPTYLDVDITNKNLFWVEASNNRIMKANLDGSEARAIVDQNLTWPNALTFDSASRRLYWMDAKHKRVGCFDVDRNEPQEIPGIEVSHPTSAAVWEDKIYWNDWADNRLYSALKKDGRNKTTILKFKVNGIGIYHPQMMHDVSASSKSECDCSHICLPSPVSPPLYHKCACPSELQLSQNGKNCYERDDLSYLLLAAEDKVYSATLREFRPPLTKLFSIRTSLQQISDLDYDPIDDTLFIADKGSGKVIKVELARRVAVPVIQGLKRVMGVAADWSRRNIYWVDSLEGSLEVATTGGHYRRRLNLGTSCSGLSVAISTSKGRVVVACDSPRGKILSCTRSGAPCVVLVQDRVRTPLGVSIDHWSGEDHVYWTDSWYRTINSVSLDGTSRRKFMSSSYSFGAILRTSGRLFASRVGDYASLFYRTNLTDDQSEESLLIDVSIPSRQHRNHWALTEVVRLPERVPLSSYETFCRSSAPQCKQLCLEDDNGKVCACSSNEELDVDGFSCRAKTCQPGQHTCSSDGVCISEVFRCNAVKDCADASDEAAVLCNRCHAASFKCGSGNCIDETKQCDGEQDCLDSSDEMNCTEQTCRPADSLVSVGFTSCTNGGCYLDVLRCDGRKDCADASDEQNCQCDDMKFKCADAAAAATAAATPTCGSTDFKCMEGAPACIPSEKVCDSAIDCTGDVETTAVTCARGEFDCGSRVCISAHLVCDQVQHCSNGADEGRLCVESCMYNNGGCAHSCHSGARSSRCSCRRGYRLARDQKSCQDVNECLEEDPCEQLCINTPGSYRCSCVSGYTPVKNSFCRTIGGEQPRIGLLSKNYISWLGGASHAPVAFAGPHTHAVFASYDSIEGEIIVMEGNGVIGRISKSDQRWAPILSGFSGATAMEVDAVGRNVYVAQTIQNPDQQQYAVCGMKKGICYAVYEEADVEIASIAVAQRRRTIYFCINGINSRVSKIYSSPLNGKGKIEIVHKEIKNCNALALDEPKQILYWSDPDLQQLKYATFSGHHTAVYKQLQEQIRSLKVSGPTVQWLLPNGTLQYCQKRSSRSCNLALLDVPATTMVVSSGAIDYECPLCKAANCKNLCVSVASSATCLCDDVTTPRCSVSVPARPALGSSCSPDPCAPGGVCVLNQDASPTCDCHEGYEGDTCYISKTLPHSGHKYVAPLVAVLVLLVIGTAGAVLYYRYKKPLFLFERKPRWSTRSKTQVRFSNPAYGAPVAEIDGSLRDASSAPSYEDVKPEKPETQSNLVTVRMDTEDSLN